MAADATLEEDLLAARQVLLGDRQGVGREPIAAVDLGEVGCLLELALGDRYVLALDDVRMRRGEALRRRE